MAGKSPKKPLRTEFRLIGEFAIAFALLCLPIALNTRFVLAFIGALSVGIGLFYREMTRFTPWRLAEFRSPAPGEAFAESLFYTLNGFGLLIYLASSRNEPIHFALGFLGIVCVWLLVQLIYSQQYAIRYYRDNGGLVFPECSRPHWTEFLYQGFCMAACYQTSDTAITTTPMRRLVATHGILSYLLSVSIIAMMFGLVGNLL